MKETVLAKVCNKTIYLTFQYVFFFKSRIITSEVFRPNRWSCVHNTFTVHLTLLFALCSRSVCALRSLFIFTRPISLSVNSPCALRSLIVLSECAHRSCGKVNRFRHCYTSNMKTKIKNWSRTFFFIIFLAQHWIHIYSFWKIVPSYSLLKLHNKRYFPLFKIHVVW